ncbi:MAG: CBS domain-containing protein [Acidobacteriota bacterium]
MSPEQGPQEDVPLAASPPRPGTWRLFRLGDLDVEVSFGLVPLLALVALILSTQLLPAQEEYRHDPVVYWLLGLFGAGLLFASLLTHELVQAFLARSQGIPITRVSVFFQGGQLPGERDVKSPASDALLAAAGPFTALSIAAMSAATLHFLGLAEGSLLRPLLWVLVIGNLLFGLTSLIPAYPLPGGRLLRSFFWLWTGRRLRGTELACLSGRVFGGLLAVGCLAHVVVDGAGASWLWGIALGTVLWLQAGMTWRRARVRELLAHRLVSDLMLTDGDPLPRHVSVADALLDVGPRPPGSRGPRGFLVEFQGRLGGIVSLRALRSVHEEERCSTTVWDVTEPLRDEHVLHPRTSALDALERMTELRLPVLPVLDDGELVGRLPLSALLAAVEAQEPAPQPAAG